MTFTLGAELWITKELERRPATYTASERLVWNAKIESELGSKMPAAWERCSQNGSFALKLESETRFGAVWGKFVMVV